MAHYENLINNAEDIVVAISHMVVGLFSVTNLPLASTYVCQSHASVTSWGSVHLALTQVRHTEEMFIPMSSSPQIIFHAASGLTRDKCHDPLGRLIKPWCSEANVPSKLLPATRGAFGR